MAKILPEVDCLMFTNEEEAISKIREVDDSSVWRRIITREAKAYPIDNAPIMIDEIKGRALMNSIVTDESVLETMNSTNLALIIPDERSRSGFPVGDTAFSSILKRAGFTNAPVLTYNGAGMGDHKQMSPMDKATILNLALGCYDNFSLALIRDEKIRALLSGDPADYSILPFSKLAELFKKKLEENFKGINFLCASISHENASITYQVEAPEVIDGYNDILATVGVTPLKSCKVTLLSSDIGIDGANLYPMVSTGVHDIIIGTPLKLTHRNGAKVSDLEGMCDCLYTTFKTAEDKLLAMSGKKVRYPAAMIRRIGKAMGLPKKMVIPSSEDFESMYGSSCLLVDVYFYMFELLDLYDAKVKLSIGKKIDMEEACSRIAFSNIEDYDLPFDWAD